MIFEVSETLRPGEITGRNGEDEIPTGFIFTRIRKLRVKGSGQDMHTEDLGIIGQVSLRLVEVDCYRRILARVPPGYTAGLRVTGEGFDFLRSTLAQLEDREYLCLEG